MKRPRPKGVTTPKFWDCDCEANYIHPKTLTTCPDCGAQSDSNPDSLVEEVVAAGLARKFTVHLLTWYGTEQILATDEQDAINEADFPEYDPSEIHHFVAEEGWEDDSEGEWQRPDENDDKREPHQHYGD